MGASANSMNQQQREPSVSAASSAASATSYQQHSPHSSSPAIPINESSGGGGGGGHQHRYRRNSYTQAFDSPPSPPRSQPPPRPPQNKSRVEQRNHPPTSSSVPPASHIPQSSSIPISSSSSSVHKNLANRPPMPIPSNNSSGLSTLESARRIAAGDHEGIIAAQNSVSSSPHLTNVSVLRDGSNIDVVRSSGHAKLSGSRSMGSGTPVDPPAPIRQRSVGEPVRQGPPYYQSSEVPIDTSRGGSHTSSNQWPSSCMSYSDEEDEVG